MHHDEEVKPGYDLGHPMDMRILIGVFVALLCLTGLTVWVAQYDLGAIDFSIAMVIATVKATLVAVFFMHLSHDKGINIFVLISAVLFFGLFLAIVLGDATHYQPAIEALTTDAANAG